MNAENKDDDKRWVKAPVSAHPRAPAVFGVWLSPDEEVQWVWTHTPEGSYVSGYTIKARKATA